MPCTLVKMADGAFSCADVSAAKASSLVKEARSHGGKVVSAGSLYKGDEGLTFAVAEGSEAVKKQFSDAATTATGKALNVHIVAVTIPAAPPPPPPASDAAADFKARASRCAAAVKEAAKEVQALVQPALVQAPTLGKQGHYAEAAPFLERVEDGLAGGAAGPAAKAEVPAPANAEKAQFTERLKALRPRLCGGDRDESAQQGRAGKGDGTGCAGGEGGHFRQGLEGARWAGKGSRPAVCRHHPSAR